MSNLNLSGSAGFQSLIDELEKIVDSNWVDEGLAEMCKPTYCLQFDRKKIKVAWLYSSSHKTLLPYNWGISIEPLEEYEPEDKEVPCVIGHDLVMVPPDYIVDVGWN
jgi:hypothetical protein